MLPYYSNLIKKLSTGVFAQGRTTPPKQNSLRNSQNNTTDQLDRPIGQTRWTDQLDGPAGRTGWTDQFKGQAERTSWTDQFSITEAFASLQIRRLVF